MDADVIAIYKKLYSKYPSSLILSTAKGIPSNIEYPVLSGESSLGKLEMFYGDFSFEFYVTHEREVVAHWHLQTAIEAEQAVVDFLNGKITNVEFGIKYDG